MNRSSKLTAPEHTALFLSMRHLALLLNSGLNLSTAVTVLIAQQQRKRVKTLLSHWHDQLQSGISLHQAAQQLNDRWPSSLLGYLAVGEQTGQLPTALNYAVDEFEQAKQQRQLLIKAVRYPAIISLFAIVISIGLLVWVLPQFTTMFGQQQLPWLTQQLLILADGVKKWGYSIVAIVTVIVLGLALLRQYSAKGWQALLLRLPIFGKLLELARLQQLFLRLSLSLQVGMPALQAIQQVQRASYWQRCHQQLAHIHHLISEGTCWTDAFTIISHQYPLANAYIVTGEQSGLLDKMLQSLAADLQRQLQARTNAWLNNVEPLLMLVLGGIIGTLLLAMYLPIFTLGQQLN